MIMKKGKKKRADATVGTISGGGGGWLYLGLDSI